MNMKQFMWMSSSFLLEIRIYRGWGYIGKHSGVWESNSVLTFSAIIAFSELYFYDILINEDSNNSYTFRYFLDKLTETRRNQF